MCAAVPGSRAAGGPQTQAQSIQAMVHVALILGCLTIHLGCKLVPLLCRLLLRVLLAWSHFRLWRAGANSGACAADVQLWCCQRLLEGLVPPGMCIWGTQREGCLKRRLRTHAAVRVQGNAMGVAGVLGPGQDAVASWRACGQPGSVQQEHAERRVSVLGMQPGILAAAAEWLARSGIQQDQAAVFGSHRDY